MSRPVSPALVDDPETPQKHEDAMTDETTRDALLPGGVTRRALLVGAGAAAISTGMGAVPGIAQTPDDFDIDAAFAGFMSDLGRSATDSVGAVTFTGRDPILRSHFRIGTSMALPGMAAAVGAAAIWADRTGEGQDVSIDLRDAVMNVNPLIGLVMQQRVALGMSSADDPVETSVSWFPKANGRLLQAPVGFDNPLTFVPFLTKDGRHMNITGAYPHLMDRALTLLEATPNRASIAAAVARWDGEDLEAAMFENRVVGVMHRTTAEWLAHPEGAYLAGTPLIEIRKVGDAPPLQWTENPTQPLSGLKALTLTHVIAGSTAARTLSEYGAEVLHIMRDQSFEHEAIWIDVNVGMRSANLNLNVPGDSAALTALLADADVMFEGFSGRGIERLGFGIEQVVAQKPEGIVYTTVRGYSWDGPWKNVPTFDMEAVAATGFTYAEGYGGEPDFGGAYGDPKSLRIRPVFPPTLVMNDYIAGYLAAAGTIEALRRRATEGGSWHVHVNLARAAMWYASLGMFPSTDFEVTADNRLTNPELFVFQSPYGEVESLHPMAKLSSTPGRWQEPLLSVRGADRALWKDQL
jgi:crotonobetainyl-CoA:carnitine CoA-transferase CaiB-like acyl-CoA transferase